MVEFALVLPVLLLILLAIMKFGILFENYLTLTDAVRSGARTLAIGRGTADACTPAKTQVVNSAPGLGLTTANVTTTLAAGDTCAALTSGNSATVSVNNFSCDLSIMGVNFLPGCKLNVSATERIE